jgi:hypothetical protein
LPKKIVSRISHTLEFPLIYITICFPGTEKMNIGEVEKYYKFFKQIIFKLTNNKIPKNYLGFIIN